MKLLRTKRRRSRSTVSESDILFLGALLVLTLAQVPRLQRGYVVCVRIQNVCQVHIAFLTHTFPLYINHLHQCVSGVSGVSAFLSCIYGFLKHVFFF